METYVLVLGFAAGIYMAWNIGANDVANAMAASVGSKAITLVQAICIAGVLDFVGATFVGSHVTKTIRKNIVDPSILSDPHIVMLGLLAALFAAGFWVFFSTYCHLPVSTTHSIVGAMIGFGIIAGGGLSDQVVDGTWNIPLLDRLAFLFGPDRQSHVSIHSQPHSIQR